MAIRLTKETERSSHRQIYLLFLFMVVLSIYFSSHALHLDLSAYHLTLSSDGDAPGPVATTQLSQPLPSSQNQLPPKFHSKCDLCDEEPQCQPLLFDYPGGIENRTAVCQTERRDCIVQCIDRTVRSTSIDQTQSLMYAFQGDWIQDLEYCHAHRNTTQSCLLDRYRYSGIPTTYSNATACQLLESQNITRIKMIGDSLIRNMFQGMAMLLTGNYDSLGFGATSSLDNPRCSGIMAFDPNCKTIPPPKWVCSGSIQLIMTHTNPRQTEADQAIAGVGGSKTLILYGVGNHPVYPQPYGTLRHTILNADEYIQGRWESVYKTPRFWGTNNILMWVPPHYKLSIGALDETNVRAVQFLQGSARFFQGLGVPTLSTFRMTEDASRFLCRKCNYDNFTNAKVSCDYGCRETCQASLETWDGYHYGRDINIWKSHMALNLLEKLVSSR